MTDYRGNIWYEMGVKLETERLEKKRQEEQREKERREQKPVQPSDNTCPSVGQEGTAKSGVAASSDVEPPQAEEGISQANPDSKFSFPCPNCSKLVKAPIRVAGRDARCPGCAQIVVVPKHVRFCCPSCSRSIKAPVHLIGVSASCPGCGNGIMVVDGLVKPQDRAASEGTPRDSERSRERRLREEAAAQAVQAAVRAVQDMTVAEMVRKLVELANYFAGGGRSSGNPELVNEVMAIGRVLDDRGGISEMRRVFNMIPPMQGKRTVEMQWDGIGSWRG